MPTATAGPSLLGRIRAVREAWRGGSVVHRPDAGEVLLASYVDDRGRLLDQHGRPLTKALLRDRAGAPGTVIFSGQIQASDIDYATPWIPPTRWTTVETMGTDETIEGIYGLIQLAMLSTEHRIEPASDSLQDREVADFVRSETVDRSDGWVWADLIEQAMAHLSDGCAFLVPQWEARTYRRLGQRMCPTRMEQRFPSTIESWIPGPGGSGDFGGFKQRVFIDGKQQLVDVLAGRTIALWNRRKGANWWGRSAYRALYRHWLVKDMLIRFIGVNAERFGVGTIIGRRDPAYQGLVPGDMGAGLGDGQSDDFSTVLQRIRSHERGSAILPPGYLAELLGGGQAVASIDHMLGAVKYFDSRMGDVFGQQFMNLGREASGSWALGKTLSQVALWAIEAILARIRRAGQQLVDMVTWLNYDVEDAPQYRTEPVRLEDADALATRLKTLKEAGLLTPQRTDEDLIRRWEHLPELPEEEVEPEREREERRDEDDDAEEMMDERLAARRPRPRRIAARRQPRLHAKTDPYHDVHGEPRGEWQPWRAIRPEESAVEFSRIDRELRSSVDTLAADLAGKRRELVASVLPMLVAEMRRDDYDAQRMRSIRGRMFARAGEIEKAAKETLHVVARRGRMDVRGEMGRARKTPMQAAAGPVESWPELQNFLAASGSMMADQILDPAWGEVLSVMESAKRRGLVNGELFTAAVEALAEAGVRKAVAARVHEAMGLGRNAELRSLGVETVTYSALLDEATCGPCKEQDGRRVLVGSDEFDALSQPLRASSLSPGCDGRDWCRCTWIGQS